MAIITSYPHAVPTTNDLILISKSSNKTTRSTTVSDVIDLIETGLLPGVGTVTSIGVTAPSAFTVTNSPVTSTGAIAIAGSGTTSQYIDGTGSLQDSANQPLDTTSNVTFSTITGDGSAITNIDKYTTSYIDTNIYTKTEADGLFSSGFVGAITPTSAAPTQNGLYSCLTSGTYTNFGGEVVSLSNQVVSIAVENNQNTFAQIVTPVSISIDSTPTLNSINAVSSGGVFNSNILLQDDIQNKSTKIQFPQPVAYDDPSSNVNTFTFTLLNEVKQTVTATIVGGTGQYVNKIYKRDSKNRRISNLEYNGSGYTEVVLEAGTKYIEILQQNKPLNTVWDIHFLQSTQESEELITSNILNKSTLRNGKITLNAGSTDFDIIEAVKTYVSDYLKVTENESYVFGYSTDAYAFIRDQYIMYLDANKNLISSENLIGQAKRVNGGWYGAYITTPANCEYVVTTVVNWDSLFDVFGTTNFVFCKYNDIQEAVEFNQSNNINFSDIKQSYEPITSNTSILVLGDSIAATSYGVLANAPTSYPIVNEGGWTAYFIETVRPKKWFNYSVGGYTLSDTDYVWNSGVLTTTDDSFIKRLENAITDYQNGTIDAPNWLVIAGCTNDMIGDESRFVSSSDLAGADYNTYMEANFISTDAGGYDNITLKDIETVNLTKIAGAVRYIIQRAGTIWPDCKFIIKTPYWDTAHKISEQRGCVNELRWIAERLSIPVYDVQKLGQLPMLWDFKLPNGTTPHRFLSDRIHSYFPDLSSFESVKREGRGFAEMFKSLNY